jgi:hypothetical protein
LKNNLNGGVKNMANLKKYWILALAVILIIVGIVLNSIYGNVSSAGQFSSNYFAAGDFSMGIFAAGTFAIGVFSIGIFSIGIFSIGIFSIGLFSVGLFVIAKYKKTLKIEK